MFTTIIIDDEKNAVDVLYMQLTKYCPEVMVVEKCTSGAEGITAIKRHKPDIVFLDIEMPHVSGFDVLEATKNIGYQVIFTTAYDQFAIKAIKFSALDYLLKPIDIEELKNAVSRIRPSEPQILAAKLEHIYEALNIQHPKANKIALPFGGGYEMVSFEHIIRAESESNYTTVFLDDGKKSVLSKTLSEVEKLLPASQFYRIHHSHLININRIRKIFKSDGGYIIMDDNCQVNISRGKKDEFWDIVSKG